MRNKEPEIIRPLNPIIKVAAGCGCMGCGTLILGIGLSCSLVLNECTDDTDKVTATTANTTDS